jgi:hypothetical protein
MSTGSINSLLLSPDFFRCEKTSCTMRKSACAARQKQGFGSTPAGGPTIPMECEECSQGLAIARELGAEQRGHVTKIRKSKTKDKTMDQTKVCTKCHIEKQLEEFHLQSSGKFGRNSICKKCKSKKVVNYVSEEELKQAAELRKESQAKISAPSLPQASMSASSTITLNLERYQDVLEWLSQKAFENFRTPDQQALFILHQVAAAGGRS